MNLPSKSATLGKTSLMPQEEKLETGRKRQKMTIGIPCETAPHEGRIPLTPLTVKQLTDNGHVVLIEQNAGMMAKFPDMAYSESGATICKTKTEVYQADIIIKVAPFSPDEIELMKTGQIVMSTLQISNQETGYFQALQRKKVTALAFEFLKDEYDQYPIVRSMSEIAGSTSVLIAAEYLSNVHQGKGEMLGGITGVSPTEIVILGAGTAGEYAARTAIGLGAMVKVFDLSTNRLRRLTANLGINVFTSALQPQVLEKSLRTADVAIGAMRQQNTRKPFFVSEGLVEKMKPNSVIIDVSIDHGGCFETSRLTNHANPVFHKHNVLHYCVPNIASRVARTASYALGNIFAPLLLSISDAGGINNIIKEMEGIRSGVYAYNGILTNRQIGQYFDLPYKDIDLLLLAF